MWTVLGGGTYSTVSGCVQCLNFGCFSWYMHRTAPSRTWCTAVFSPLWRGWMTSTSSYCKEQIQDQTTMSKGDHPALAVTCTYAHIYIRTTHTCVTIYLRTYVHTAIHTVLTHTYIIHADKYIRTYVLALCFHCVLCVDVLSVRNRLPKTQGYSHYIRTYVPIYIRTHLCTYVRSVSLFRRCV